MFFPVVGGSTQLFVIDLRNLLLHSAAKVTRYIASDSSASDSEIGSFRGARLCTGTAVLLDSGTGSYTSELDPYR